MESGPDDAPRLRTKDLAKCHERERPNSLVGVASRKALYAASGLPNAESSQGLDRSDPDVRFRCA